MEKTETKRGGAAQLLRRAVCRLHLRGANRRPSLFLLEIGAALLTLLALCDGLLGTSTVSSELLCAAGLWIVVLATACRLAMRHRAGRARSLSIDGR
jgi:high-affinity K+ transport system ATPase subunit B